jgi:hypothetical protein
VDIETERISRKDKGMKAIIAIALGVMLVSSGLASAGLNAGLGKGAVHVMPHASRTCAKNFPSISGCTQIQTTTGVSDADCFPVFYELVEYQGFDYGLVWPGTYTCAFTSCSDLAIGTIQNTGDGVSHAWYVCQPGPVAICGWGWIYDSGLVCLVAHPTAGGPVIGDCSGGLDQPIATYCAGIGGTPGEDPCAATTIAPTTWGAIKGMFE